MTNDPIFLDFETKAIGPRPDYPPQPVGLAVLDRTGQFKSDYYSFGHFDENNSTFEETKEVLQQIWDSGRSICFHNLMFDLCIIHEIFGLPYLSPDRMNDTLVMAFLKDPYVKSLSLKELCNEWLGIKPDERDELFEWIVANIPEAAKKPKTAGAYISDAPSKLTGTYAMADVRLTSELYDHCRPVVDTMETAYLREIELMPVLLDNSRHGVRLDRDAMLKAMEKAAFDIKQCEDWLNNYFESTEINYNSGVQLVKAIFAKGVNNKELDWPASDKGTPLSDKETISKHVTDEVLVSVLRHRDLLSKLMGTYMEPWAAQSEKTGRIYTEWNTVRGEAGGTRTGRLSAKPTLQTMPSRGPKTPLPPEIKELTIPKIRSFILPDEGHKMVACDFQAQELRLFAHFEGGQLAEQYQKNPRVDLHQFACDLMSKKAGKTVIRDYAKTLSFGILYGSGPNKISEMLNISYDEAKELITLYKSEVATGLAAINDDLMRRYKTRTPFKTVGGRYLKGEPPKVIGNRAMSFGYKSLNALIQGSGADQAKQAMIDFAKRTKHARLLLSLHDEIIISCKEGYESEEGELLMDCMINAFQLDVPFVSDVKIGNNFSEVK